MKRSPKTELFEDGLQSGTFRKRRFPVLVWTRIFLKTDKKSCVFKRKRIRVDKALDAAPLPYLRPGHAAHDNDTITIQTIV